MDVFKRDELYRLVDRVTLPGINPEEVPVTREWIRRYGREFDELRFNVRVGVGITLEGPYPQKLKDDWFQRTRMKPDLVAYTAPNQSTIVEAKVQWLNDAVWQLLHYRDLYAAEFPEHAIRLVGVCQAYTPQSAQLASDSGIRLHVYGFPGDLPLAAATTETTP
jgi:hypothetical protein